MTKTYRISLSCYIRNNSTERDKLRQMILEKGQGQHEILWRGETLKIHNHGKLTHVETTDAKLYREDCRYRGRVRAIWGGKRSEPRRCVWCEEHHDRKGQYCSAQCEREAREYAGFRNVWANAEPGILPEVCTTRRRPVNLEIYAVCPSDFDERPMAQVAGR
jgi:hypothetical protein